MKGLPLYLPDYLEWFINMTLWNSSNYVASIGPIYQRNKKLSKHWWNPFQTIEYLIIFIFFSLVLKKTCPEKTGPSQICCFCTEPWVRFQLSDKKCISLESRYQRWQDSSIGCEDHSLGYITDQIVSTFRQYKGLWQCRVRNASFLFRCYFGKKHYER